MDDRVLDLAVNAEGGLTLPEAEVATGLAAPHMPPSLHTAPC
jgi:hypothetical protein